jgi:hypothetical protein
VKGTFDTSVQIVNNLQKLADSGDDRRSDHYLEMTELTVGLNAWIIQDGNYEDFERGESYKLALEFGGSALTPSDERAMRCAQNGGCRYDVVAQVIFATHDVWVIDFGVKVFSETRPPRFAKAGQWVKGLIWLGVDPFSYKERLHRMPRMPNLFLEWVVVRIQLETTRRIEDISGTEKLLERDSEHEQWVDRTETNAWGGRRRSSGVSHVTVESMNRLGHPRQRAMSCRRFARRSHEG